jgi:hypothetical protein
VRPWQRVNSGSGRLNRASDAIITLQRSISTTSVAIELDQPLVADPEVMRDLVEHDMPDLAA